MTDPAKRLFVGIKITPAVQAELNNPAPGTQRYFEDNDDEFLQIIELGEDKIIGRYVKNGCAVADLGDVSRNVCSIVKLITRGRRIDDRDVHIYTTEV